MHVQGTAAVFSALFRSLYSGLWVSWYTSDREQCCTVAFLLVLVNGRNATVCEFILSIWHGAEEQVVVGNSCGSANSIRPYRPARDSLIWPESDLVPPKPFCWQRERQKEPASQSQRELRWKEGAVLRMSFAVSGFFCFFFNSHGVTDTLESYEVCCSACVLLVIGQSVSAALGYGEKQRDGKDHGLQKHVESVYSSIFLFWLSRNLPCRL